MGQFGRGSIVGVKVWFIAGCNPALNHAPVRGHRRRDEPVEKPARGPLDRAVQPIHLVGERRFVGSLRFVLETHLNSPPPKGRFVLYGGPAWFRRARAAAFRARRIQGHGERAPALAHERDQEQRKPWLPVTPSCAWNAADISLGRGRPGIRSAPSWSRTWGGSVLKAYIARQSKGRRPPVPITGFLVPAALPAPELERFTGPGRMFREREGMR